MASKNANKIVIVVAAVLLAGAFFAFDLQQYFTLDYLKAQQQQFQAFYQANPFLVIGVFFTVYVIVTALSLPGAAVMTLAGSAFLGFWVGLVVVSFASTIGATVACAVARYLFRDVVQNRFGDKLERVQQGVEREGAFYLFTMRLIPAIPFFVINLVMGLTRMKLWTFCWVSQLGMLPGTAVYVNAGRELGQIDKLSDVLSPGLIISFVLLGVFPLAAKKTMNYIRARQGKKVLKPEEQ